MTHKHNISLITSKRRRRERICTTSDNYVFNSRVGESLPKVYYTQPCKTGLSVPAIKMDNTRGYNTGNVPQSYGPEDGNLYGDASHREAEDESATVSKNMRRVPQNEAPAHGFSGGRTAQGTMSRSSEAAAQSGKAYYQEPDR